MKVGICWHQNVRLMVKLGVHWQAGSGWTLLVHDACKASYSGDGRSIADLNHEGSLADYPQVPDGLDLGPVQHDGLAQTPGHARVLVLGLPGDVAVCKSKDIVINRSRSVRPPQSALNSVGAPDELTRTLAYLT